MPKDPAFLFYSQDFLTGVSDLTMEERGQYITLLCLQHQKGRLSGKAVALAVGNAAADVLAKFKKDENGLYYNERLELETAKRAEHAEKQRQRAVEGWKKRKKKNKRGNATADATALPLENENENENEDKDENKKRGSGGKEPNLNYQIKELFEEVYAQKTNLGYAWSEKDWGQTKNLITKIKSSYKKKYGRDPTEKETLDSMRIVFENLPEWYVQNGFSISVIVSKYNEILNSIANGSSKIKQLNDTRAAIEKINAMYGQD